MDIDEKKQKHARPNLVSGQKLTLAEIRQIAPDSIRITYISGDLRPERHYLFTMIEGNENTYYNDEELDLSTEEITMLKEEFDVQEGTMQVTPGPAAMQKAQLEWEEWEKKHGKRPRFQPQSDE